MVVGMRGSHVDTCARGLPREPRPRPSELGRCCARGVEPAEPVLEHRPRCRRIGRGEEWQDEDITVPEDVSAISRAGEAAGSDRSFAGLGRRSHQVEEREAHEPLQLVVTLDLDVGGLPALGPALPVRGEQAVEAPPLRFPQSAQCFLRVGHRQRIGDVGGKPFESVALETLGRRDSKTSCARMLTASTSRRPRLPALDLGSLCSLERLVGLEQRTDALGAKHCGAWAGER